MKALVASARFAMSVIMVVSLVSSCGLGGPDDSSSDTTDTSTPGTNGQDGLNCWDLNGNGVFDPETEDIDKNGYATVEDCRGADGANGVNGTNGKDGKSCTTVPADGGAVIKCSDGTETFVANGTDGATGARGPRGPRGPQGEAGTTGATGPMGESCTVSLDHNGCQVITCGQTVSEPLCGTDVAPTVGCETDTDCGTQWVCFDGDISTKETQFCSDHQCVTNNYEFVKYCDFGCDKGACKPECVTNVDCPNGQACNEVGECVTNVSQCTNDVDCYVDPVCSGNVLGVINYMCQSGQCVSVGSGSTNCPNGCANGACVETTLNCDDGDGCTIDTVSNGACAHSPKSCDDGNAQTTDSCSAGTCVNTSVSSTNGGTIAVTWTYPTSSIAAEADQLELYVECYTGTGAKVVVWNTDAKKIAKGSYTGSLTLTKSVTATITSCKANAHLLAVTTQGNYDLWDPSCSSAAGTACVRRALGVFSYTYVVGSTTYSATLVADVLNGEDGRKAVFYPGSDNDGDGYGNSNDAAPGNATQH